MCPWPLYAFTSTSHYFTATQRQDWALDSYSHWDSEAASDFLTYQHPLSWENQWLRGQKVFDLSVGSISSKQFLIQERIKLSQPLTENLEFHFHWMREGDFEQDRSQVPLELKYKVNTLFALSFFGSPALYKSEDDLGLSLFLTPSSEWEIRLSGAWGDYDRNQRNLKSDKWSEPPFSTTLSAQWLPTNEKDEFIYTEAHWERPSQRTDNGLVTQDLSYESISASGWLTRNGGQGFGGRFLYDRAFASDGTSPRTRKRSLNQLEYTFIMGPHIVRPGLNYFYRESRFNGEQIIYRELLPSIWMQLIPRSWSWGTGIPSLGYDATVFHKQEKSSTERDLEHRLNIKYDMQFKMSGQLALLFTFDLDHFGSSQTWEGGAAQFRLDF